MEEKVFEYDPKKYEMKKLKLSNLKRGDLVLVTIKQPPVTDEEVKWFNGLRKKGYFGEANVLIIPEGIKIAKENINKLIPLEEDNDE